MPSPVLPHPNAFDHYMQAANAIAISDKTINEGLRRYAAFKKIGTVALARRQAEVMRNQRSIALFQEGAAYQYQEPPVCSFPQRLPHYRKFLRLGRFLVFVAQVRREEGEWVGAVEHGLQAVRLGADIQNGNRNSLIGVLLGIACASHGRREVWHIVDHLTPGQARDAIARMEAINSHATTFAQVLQEDKRQTQALVTVIFRTPDWRRKLAREEFSPSRYPMARFQLSLVHKRWSMQRLTAYYDDALTLVRQPYSPSLSEPELPNDPICRLFAPPIKGAWVKFLACRASNHLLMTALALRAYHQEYGVYPAELQALVQQGYLSSLPGDPFTASRSLRYRKSGKTYLLYSIGPDGADNHGTPIASTQHPKTPSGVITPTSAGDIVAGANVY
jgi:hypothetical protein